MRDLSDLLKTYDIWMIVGILIIEIVLVVLVVWLWRRQSRLLRRYNTRIADGSVGEIIDCIAHQTQAISALESRLDDVNARLAEHSRNIAQCLQKVGIVRFNAFEDVGGEQSFAVVLLNGEGSGLAISSLYGRQDSRVYAKRITNGESDRALSDEEKVALSEAMQTNSSVKSS